METTSPKLVTDATMSSMLYKRRPPTPTRFTKRFELGELDSDNNTSSAKSSKLNPVEREEVALKEELLRIFNREKDSMEQHYLNKIQELLRGFKSKKLEWEEMVKAEREDLESQFDSERSEMHQSFVQEIAKMTRSFQEEKNDLEKKFEEKICNRDLDVEREKRDIVDNWKEQVDNVKRQCQSEHDAMMTIEIKSQSEKHKIELQDLEKKFNAARSELEQKCARDLDDTETRYQKISYDMDKRFEEDKSKIERDWQKRLENVEDALRKETNHRIEIDRAAATDKANMQAIINMLKDEIGRLKDEIDRLRKQPIPPPEVKIIEKTVPVEVPVTTSYNSRSDLPSNLRDDFDRILNDYKETLKDKFQRDKTAMEDKLEMEKERLRERIVKEKEELDKRLNEEKFRMERDLDRSREDIEKEIERRMRTKQLSESLAAQQQRFDEVTRRLEKEEKSRRENMRDSDNRKYESLIQELTRENEGLKVKVHALEDNNKVLKNLKEEGQQEVERLRKAVEELKISVEAKRDSDRTRAQTPADYTPILMSMLQQPRKEEECTTQKCHVEELSVERKKLEDLRNEIKRQERDMREKKTIEDATKVALDQSQVKYDNLLYEKRVLVDSLKALENRVGNMQDDILKIRYHNAQPPLPPHPVIQPVQIPPPQQMYPPPQQMYPPPPPSPTQPIIVQAPTTPLPSPEKSEPQVHVIMQSPVPSQQYIPNTPLSNQNPLSYYPPSQQMFSPIDQVDKIYKLKSSRDRLNKQIEELKNEIQAANNENNILQKQCRTFERQIERFEDALEREREISSNLRDLLSEEKLKSTSLQEDVERESQSVLKIRRELQETKIKLQREILVLQHKLDQAGSYLTAVRQQAAVDEANTSNIVNRDATVGMATMPSITSPGLAALYVANTAKRHLNMTKAAESYYNGFERRSNLLNQKLKEDNLAREELMRIRSLEDDKIRLQNELTDARGALDAYASKLDSKLQTLETKVQVSTEENKNLNKTVVDMEIERTDQARQNNNLRHQKLQLQKLIERLTSMNPQP